MLKTLALTLLVLAAVHCGDGDDDQFDTQIKEYWSHAPVHTWTRFAKFSLKKNKAGNQTWVDMDIRVNLYPFPADRHLKRLYSIYNMPRDWWASSCVVKTHRQTKEVDVDIIMDTLGTPDVTDAFLLDPKGNIIMTWDQFQRSSQRTKDVATEKGLCWAMYRKREVPWNLKYVMKLAPDVNWNEYIEDCTTYDHFYVRWVEEYGRCVDKQIVKFPDMLKHSNRGTKD